MKYTTYMDQIFFGLASFFLLMNGVAFLSMALDKRRSRKAGSERIIGNDTFKYKMSKGDEPYLEVWLLTFYEVIEFLAILIPTEKE